MYETFEHILIKIDPLLTKIGYKHIDKPVTFVEKNIKGFLFDCQMCGQCILHDTGMSCPMNCPKELRNGPCGGVRPNGNCEVKPEMPCVWMEAYRGNKQMDSSEPMLTVQFPVDHRLKGTSSWLREVRKKRDQQFFEMESP